MAGLRQPGRAHRHVTARQRQVCVGIGGSFHARDPCGGKPHVAHGTQDARRKQIAPRVGGQRSRRLDLAVALHDDIVPGLDRGVARATLAQRGRQAAHADVVAGGKRQATVGGDDAISVQVRARIRVQALGGLHSAGCRDFQVGARVSRKRARQRGRDAVDTDVAPRVQDNGRAAGRRAGDEQVAARVRLQRTQALANAGVLGGSRDAGDSQVLARAQPQLGAALRQARLADGQISARVGTQSTVGDGLAVQFRIHAGFQGDVLPAGNRAVRQQLAAGLRLQRSAGLQRTRSTQRHVAAAAGIERARVRQYRAVHAQVLFGSQRRGLTRHQRARQRRGIRLCQDRTTGLLSRSRQGGQAPGRLNDQVAGGEMATRKALIGRFQHQVA
ncbi:hypothetical protein AL520_30000 [Achromobacter xylosoxidans]|nr:hypothetical protein AL520_30000 [Achromobacter xylosoxidans]